MTDQTEDATELASKMGFMFLDAHLGEALFVQRGEWTGWIFKRHPDGHWVSVRMANDQDLVTISLLIAKGN